MMDEQQQRRQQQKANVQMKNKPISPNQSEKSTKNRCTTFIFIVEYIKYLS